MATPLAIQGLSVPVRPMTDSPNPITDREQATAYNKTNINDFKQTATKPTRAGAVK